MSLGRAIRGKAGEAGGEGGQEGGKKEGRRRKEGRKKEGQGELNIQEEREEKKGPHCGPKFSYHNNTDEI